MISETSESPPVAEPPHRQGVSARAMGLGALLLLLIGIIGGGWAASRYIDTNNSTELVPEISDGSSAAADGPMIAVSPPFIPAIAAPSPDVDTLATRVVELEQRLARISSAAQSASGNATRAEGLLVAFAVRRALDRGLPLGYLEPQLRLRFADAQPNAVKTIIDTARDPVTIEQLRGELELLTPRLIGGVGYDSESFWTAIRRELGELIVLRPAKSLATGARERLERARRYLTAAQVDKAIAEVEAMPGAAIAEEWVIDARRYHEARRALDLVETAAILEPRESTPVANSVAEDQDEAEAG